MAIIKRGDVWQVQVRVGKDAAGRWIRKAGTCDTHSQAEALERRLLADAARLAARFVSPSDVPLGEFAADWLERESARLRPTTQALYASMVRVHIAPTLGNVRLADLSPRRVQAWLDGMGPRQRTEDARALLGTILRDAQRLGYVESNVVDRTRAPHRNKLKRQSFDLDELARIMEAAARYRMRNMIAVAAYTGLRRGELLGLRWEDVDFDAPTLAVVRQVVELKNRPCVQEHPKTDAGRRVVPLVLPAVAALRAQQALLRAEAVVGPWVFPSSRGTLPKPGVATDIFRRIVAKAGVEPRPFHALRHTAASILLGAGVEPALCAKVMGHASLAVFYATYADLLPAAGEQVGRQVNAFLAGATRKNEAAHRGQ